VALLLSFLLFLVPVGIGCGVYFLREQRWAAMLARVDELSVEFEPPPLARLPLGRPMVPGNAWDDYLHAFPARGAALPESISNKISPFLERKKEGNRAEVESLVVRFAPTIEVLSRGARRLEARLPRKPPPGYTSDLHVDTLYLNQLAIAKARLLAEEGRIPEALDLLTDVCIHGRDCAQLGRGFSTGLSGIGHLHHALRELRDILQSRDVDPEELLSLERRLQGVDDHFPEQRGDLENDLKELGLLFIQEDLDDTAHHTINGKRERRSWRFFYSSRLQAATGFAVADRLVRQVLEARNLPWSERFATIDAAARELSESKDEILGVRFMNLHGALQDTQVRASLRLLRLAAHYRATGELVEIEDPFGGRIRTRMKDGVLLAWHRSFPGDNWNPQVNSDDYWFTESIEVRRK